MRVSIKKEQNKKDTSNTKQLQSSTNPKLKNNSLKAQEDKAIQQKMNVDASKAEIIQNKKNKTGLPDNLKSGIENLSGYTMDDVKVHYNSSKPAKVQAHAYAQGTDIHLASGQEKHLPHEAWHVVQQKQGRVKPTTTVAGMAVNDNVGLEKEADVMGGMAMQMKQTQQLSVSSSNFINNKIQDIGLQLKKWGNEDGLQNVFWGELLEKDKWFDYYYKQEQIMYSGEFKNENELGLHYTTFGLEYEMIPYDPKHALANTAHITLATGGYMPVVPSVKNKLVTDSDNVVEYVTPVLITPSDSNQVRIHINHAKRLLEGLNEAVRSAKTINELIACKEMGFTDWNLYNVKGSHKEIDENTNIKDYRDFLDNDNDAGGMSINNGFWGKNKKLNEDGGKGGGGMQATVLVPMEFTAKFVSNSREKGMDPETKSRRLHAEKTSGQKRVKLDRTKILKDIKDGIAGELKDLLFSKIELVLNHQYVVEHQDYFQKIIYAKVRNEEIGVLENKCLVKFEEIKDLDLKQDKNQQRLDNFHNWHSYVKDELDVWVRVTIADIIYALQKETNIDISEQLIEDLNQSLSIKKSKPLDEEFKVLRNAILDAKYTSSQALDGEYNPPGFLDVDSSMPDLRQDTLRKVVLVEGKPWVQIEVRDLTDETVKQIFPEE